METPKTVPLSNCDRPDVYGIRHRVLPPSFLVTFQNLVPLFAAVGHFVILV